ncbi:hypothetical protein F8388_008683 [Cannabis sativa]|uniref:Uncharacterized protein n=1 Tax=Cannabis sativa TaxID=3483 RepID=A0A7J6DPI8_CANSA|nr:hypothetical protein F8388_008683 [Cannabis sativa]
MLPSMSTRGVKVPRKSGSQPSIEQPTLAPRSSNNKEQPASLSSSSNDQLPTDYPSSSIAAEPSPSLCLNGSPRPCSKGKPLLHYQPPEWLFCLPRFPLPRQELVRQVRTPTLSSMTALFDASNRVDFPYASSRFTNVNRLYRRVGWLYTLMRIPSSNLLVCIAPNYRSDPPDEKLNSALLLSRRTYPPRDSWNFCGLRWRKSTKARQIDRLLSRC